MLESAANEEAVGEQATVLADGGEPAELFQHELALAACTTLLPLHAREVVGGTDAEPAGH